MELPKVEELKKLVKFCRENGVSTLKHGEFEISLSATSHFPDKRKSKDEEKPLGESQVDEETALFWSSSILPGGDS